MGAVLYQYIMFQRHPIQNEVMMFITTNLQARRILFADPAYAREAIDTLYTVQNLKPFFLFGFVIMPDHCHFLLKVPSPGKISRIMNVYKGCTSANIALGPIWQTRFHLIIPRNSWKVLEYIHLNPVKAGLVEKAVDYPWSSACGRWDVSCLE